MSRFIYGILWMCLLTFVSCSSTENKSEGNSLFQKITAAQSGIEFINALTESDSFNYFSYPYIYEGGGVSVADFNNDGLTDIYFVGNMVANRLYLNKGDLRFEDITELSGIGGDKRWMLGSTTCDINNDGLIDIYVSVSGKDKVCKNILFVNLGVDKNGIPKFEDQAEQYNIADEGCTTQSVFFDYDNDGDLDLYVANYPITKFSSPAFYYKQMMINAKMITSDHLYKNNGDGSFTDATEEAGLLNFGLSLGINTSDVNNDGWKDIYVSNDFASPDHLYINNGDGTFSDRIKDVTKQTSYYGMGLDIADFNNDGLMDIIQVDMAPADNRRLKENTTGMNPETFSELVDLGLHHQYTYNTLQLNRGLDKDHLPVYSNIAWLAGVSRTDWSWSPLFADFDNDGWKDIFISNGTRRELNNNDFFDKIRPQGVYPTTQSAGNKRNQMDDIKKMPSESISNYIFKNNQDLTFSNMTSTWGLEDKTFSNGAVYADLDNDGDLELIINNIDGEALIYKNSLSEKQPANFLKIELEGPETNRLGLGTKAEIWSNGKYQMGELTLSRGYESSSEPILYFGLGNQQLDSVLITWPDGGKQLLGQVKVNQKLIVKYKNAVRPDVEAHGHLKPLFKEISGDLAMLPLHKENNFNDFLFQMMLPHKMSTLGPALAVGDVNNDGLDDFYFGGASGFEGALYLQTSQGSFQKIAFEDDNDKVFEDLGASFFDVDNDKDLDLYIVSGGNEFSNDPGQYQDRLFTNVDGKFIKAKNSLPKIFNSGSCVRPYDYDQDGDLDLFIGGCLKSGNYPYPGTSYILENKVKNGQAHFEIVTDKVAPELTNIGMVTDALWTDVNNDNAIDLIVVGEWMPVTIFINENGKLINRSKTYLQGNTTGWWLSIGEGDFDQDGDMDYILGNLGLNYRYQASKGAPFSIYANDFDNNNKTDIILGYYNFGKEYPLHGMSRFIKQIPALKTKYRDYASFSEATIEDIFRENNLKSAITYHVESFASVYLKNTKDGLKLIKLPNEAQLAPISDMIVKDYDGDGNLDLVVSGNLYSSETEIPRSDAGIGLFLKGDGKGNFKPLSFNESGILIPYDAKQLDELKFNGKPGIISASNQGPVQIFVSNK